MNVVTWVSTDLEDKDLQGRVATVDVRLKRPERLWLDYGVEGERRGFPVSLPVFSYFSASLALTLASGFPFPSRCIASHSLAVHAKRRGGAEGKRQGRPFLCAAKTSTGSKKRPPSPPPSSAIRRITGRAQKTSAGTFESGPRPGGRVMGSTIRDYGETSRFFPLRDVGGVRDLFEAELAREEPDLALLSAVVGYLENQWTQARAVPDTPVAGSAEDRPDGESLADGTNNPCLCKVSATSTDSSGAIVFFDRVKVREYNSLLSYRYLRHWNGTRWKRCWPSSRASCEATAKSLSSRQLRSLRRPARKAMVQTVAGSSSTWQTLCGTRSAKVTTRTGPTCSRSTAT